MRNMHPGIIGLFAIAAGLTACSDESGEGTGDLSVMLQGESTITEGIDPGDGLENIRDGWEVRFEKYILAVGGIEVNYATNKADHADALDVFAVDLKAVPEAGLPLWSLSGLRTGAWQFGYSTPSLGPDAKRHESVTQVDFDAMRAAGATYLIKGAISKAQGVSCPPPTLAMPGDAASTGNNSGGHACYANPNVQFEYLVDAATDFGPCELDGVPGFTISQDSTQSVAITIHGDHMFFNGFPEGSEGGVTRLAQWLADSDLNLNGTVTREELEAIAPSALSELDARYQLGAPPITPLDNMWKYVAGQLKTQGHMNGEGECDVDGDEHGH